MKLLPFFLLNVVTVVAAIWIYDEMRTGDEGAAAPVLTRDEGNAAFEERLAALEAARRPMLQAAAPDPRLVARLEQLERVLAERPPAAGEATTSAEDAAPVARPTLPSPDGETLPSPEEVERFRKLQAASRRAERLQREQARITAALASVPVNLTDTQRTKLLAAHVDFEIRRNEIWGVAKTRASEAGDGIDWPTIIAETQQVVRREFVQRINTFLPQGDAELVAAALHPTRK